MDIIDRLFFKEEWLRYLEYKTAAGNESAKALLELADFVNAEAYRETVCSIVNRSFSAIPERKSINKAHSAKKRIVYTFGRETNYVLKMISYLLHDYDSTFAPNLYSFRRDRNAKDIIIKLTATDAICDYYSYKADIHNYFNSVPVDRICAMLRDKLRNETRLCDFLIHILANPKVRVGAETVDDTDKGIMAGIPISSFLANLYLSEMDFAFAERGAIYARYSDDIIVFARTEAELQLFTDIIADFICKYGLELNPDKVYITSPGQTWTFLGFSFDGHDVDVSDISLEKLKAKMKRKSRALRRWMKRKGADSDAAIRVFIREFNRKFFEDMSNHDLTWCRWYFPLITTDKSLHILDSYMQQCIRYVKFGHYKKSNYNLRYDDIKALGYRSLVAAYYNRETYN